MRSAKWFDVRVWFAIVLVAASASTIAQAPVANSQSKTAEDLTAIRAAAEEFLRALDNLDWEPLRASWASNPSVFFPFADTPDRVSGFAASYRCEVAGGDNERQKTKHYRLRKVRTQDRSNGWRLRRVQPCCRRGFHATY